MLRRRDGKPGLISQRFDIKRRNAASQERLHDFEEKLLEAGHRIGFDLTDQALQKKLRRNFQDRKESTIKGLGPMEMAERFLEMAYMQYVLATESNDEDGIIDALCLGNWLVGVLGSMPLHENFSRICIPCAIKAHASKNGKVGIEKKLKPLRELEQWARERYLERTWPSANKAAHELMSAVLEHGRTIGAVLAEQNAQRTIAGWFRKK